MKFAIIETGGKQYRISPDESLRVEKLEKDLKEGDAVVFDKVLLVEDAKGTTIGTPYIEGVTIKATFESRTKDKKVSILRFRSKSNWHRRLGHRQTKDSVKISAK